MIGNGLLAIAVNNVVTYSSISSLHGDSRTITHTCDVPAALESLTDWGQDEDRRKTKEAGFNRRFVKPVEQAALTGSWASLGA